MRQIASEIGHGRWAVPTPNACPGGLYSPPMNICSVSFHVCHCEPARTLAWQSVPRQRNLECHCEAAEQPWQSVLLKGKLSIFDTLRDADCITSLLLAMTEKI